MPPLGRALMGLWASEAYSFHPVSTSRFPSILFHNTPGDVYVLQDARKMRSRLHSDIGRFTMAAMAREGERERDARRADAGRGKKTTRRGNPCARERSSWDLRGRPDYFSHRRSAVLYGPDDRDSPRAPTHTCVLLRSRCEIRSLPPWAVRVGNWTLRTYLKQKGKQIIRESPGAEY